MRTRTLVALLLLLPAICTARTPHFDATQRIGVLAVGDTSYGESPILGWLSLDFAVQWQELPTDVGDVMSDKQARKIVRIYTPRTLQKLLDTYDVLIFLEPRMWFSGREIHMFKTGVDKGISSLLTLWPDPEGYLSFVDSELAPVYPQNFAPNFEQPQNVPYKAKINTNTPPVLTPFIPVGIEKFTGYKARAIHLKEGSRIWAWAIKGGMISKSDPYIISWQWGEKKSETWVIGVDVDEQWFNEKGGNQYGGDTILNMLYYSVGKPLPENIEIVHNLRSAFYQYNVQKRLVLSVMDFVDHFGANTAKLGEKIEKTDQGKKIAEEAFMKGDYDRSYQQIKSMVGELATLNQEAIKIKQRALMWVYITEWFAVTGTSLVAGFILFSLMVKRRLYRQVRTTRTSF